ncbi:MAG: hypothetical protein WDM71_11845 [Ferruginibacter sp.]
MLAATFYLLKDVSIISFNKVSFLNICVIAGTFGALHIKKFPAPIVVLFCLLLGLVF